MDRTFNLNNINLKDIRFVNRLINSFTDDDIDNEPEVIDELYKLQKFLNDEINLIEEKKEIEKQNKINEEIRIHNELMHKQWKKHFYDEIKKIDYQEELKNINIKLKQDKREQQKELRKQLKNQN